MHAETPIILELPEIRISLKISRITRCIYFDMRLGISESFVQSILVFLPSYVGVLDCNKHIHIIVKHPFYYIIVSDNNVCLFHQNMLSVQNFVVTPI